MLNESLKKKIEDGVRILNDKRDSIFEYGIDCAHFGYQLASEENESNKCFCSSCKKQRNSSKNKILSLQSENARLKEKLDVLMEFVSSMSTINEHLGYKFTQPIIKVREKIKQLRDGMGEKI
jgi:hypothetical protein